MTKGQATGQTRAIGPPPDQVEQAQEELRPDFTPSEMMEKIFEIRGRILVRSGGQGRTAVQVRADEKLGEALMACAETRKSSPSRKSKDRAAEDPSEDPVPRQAEEPRQGDAG